MRMTANGVKKNLLDISYIKAERMADHNLQLIPVSDGRYILICY